MSDFSEHARKIQQAGDSVMEAVRAEIARLVLEVTDADDRYDEQATLVASLRQTVRMQAEEIDRISTDYQAKLDASDAENAALRSRLGKKSKNFGVLARTVTAMQQSGGHIAALGAHATAIIRGDAMGDRIVTQLHHGRPQRPPTTAPEGDGLHDILDRAHREDQRGRRDGPAYAPREAVG
jgi:septal ring factor EnvC (AmiA/AmiB activator)